MRRSLYGHTGSRNYGCEANFIPAYIEKACQEEVKIQNLVKD